MEHRSRGGVITMKMHIPCFFTFLLVLSVLAAAIPVGAFADLGSLPQHDFTIIQQKAPAFKAGTYDGTILQGRTVTLKANEKNHKGAFTSPLIPLTYPALQIVPSWAVQNSQEGGWLIQIQLINDESEASPWLYLAHSGTPFFTGNKVQECLWAKVSGDSITLKKPVVAFRYKVLMYGTRMSPSFSRFELACKIAPR
jgi:hypothetical protein